MHLSFDLLHETVDTAHAVTVGHVNAGSFTFVLAPSIHAVSTFPQTFVLPPYWASATKSKLLTLCCDRLV